MALRLTAASSQYLTITSGLSGFPANSSYTIFGWIYLVTAATGSGFYFYNHSQDNNYTNGEVVNVTSAQAIRFTTYSETHNPGAGVDTTGATVLSTGTWYTFTMTYDADNRIVEVFIDGTSQGQAVIDLASRDPIIKMYLGEFIGGGSLYSNMRFWGWKMWTALLDSTELDTEATQGRPVRTAGLWASWDFEPTNRPADDSGNGHDWTEVGSPTDEAAPNIPLSTIYGTATKTLQNATLFAYQNPPTGAQHSYNSFRVNMAKLKKRRAAQRRRSGY